MTTEGALAFLNAEYRLLTIFVIGSSIVLAAIAFFMDTTYLIVVAFIIGAIFSAFAGNMGMKIATIQISVILTISFPAVSKEKRSHRCKRNWEKK